MKRRSIKITAIAGVLALAAGLCTAIAADNLSTSLEGTVHLSGLHIQEVKSDHVTLSTDAEVAASRPVTVERVDFSDMAINGIPFTVAPITGTFKLDKGSPYTLPGLQVQLLFRDMATTEPWRELVADKNVHITGHVTIEPERGLLGKLVPKSRAAITLNLDEAMTMQFGLVPWGQRNAL